MCEFVEPPGVKRWIITNSTKISPGHDNTCKNSMRKPVLQPVEDENVLDVNDDVFNIDGVGLVKTLPKISPIVIKSIKAFLDRKCNWLTTLPVSKFDNDIDFVLYSPKLLAMERGGCLKFGYHFFGLAKASFFVAVNNVQSDTNGTILWTRNVPQSTGWAQAQVHIPKQSSPFYVIFKAHLDPQYKDIIGLDDISYFSFPCYGIVAKNDFESENQVYTMDGTTIATGGKPIRDHTTNSNFGHFALSSSKNPSTLKASIKNLTYSFTSSEYLNCVKFYYQFIADKSDNDVDSYLDVNVTDMVYGNKRIRLETVISDGLERQWQLLSINIPSSKRAKDSNLTISMNTFHGTQIGIDDISVEDRACQDEYDCDFESGMFAGKFPRKKFHNFVIFFHLDFCGWSQSMYGDAIWLRADSGDKAGLKESPKYDANANENGFFAMIPNEFVVDAVYATLRSPPVGSGSSVLHCFKMAYFAHTKSFQEKVFNVVLRDLTKSGRIITSKYCNGTTYPYWANFTLPFPKNMPSRYSVEISTVFTSKSVLSDVAVDNIKFSYSCGSDSEVSTPKPTPIPYSERKWDCTFESSCSGWSYDKNWLRTSYSKLGNLKAASNPPRLDHNIKSQTGGYLLFLPKEDTPPANSTGNSTDSGDTILGIVNSTDFSGIGHCLTFYYYDSSEGLVTLDINMFRPVGFWKEKSIRPNAASRTWIRVKVDFQWNANRKLSFNLIP